MLSICFYLCQIKVKLDFYHLPPKKSRLIPSRQIVPWNALSTPLAMRCLYFFFLTHSLIQQTFPDYPPCARHEYKSYFSQSSSGCPTPLERPSWPMTTAPPPPSRFTLLWKPWSLPFTQCYFASHWTTGHWWNSFCGIWASLRNEMRNSYGTFPNL